MSLPKDYQPEFDSLVDLLLEMAQERSLERLLNMIVQRFARRPHLALAQIWLLRPGDKCPSCSFEKDCFQREHCLHLVAFSGKPLQGRDEWANPIDPLNRIPVGMETIGKIAASGEPLEVTSQKKAPPWFSQSHWIKKEGILGFSGEPLVYRGEVLGVLAIYVRIPIPKSARGRGWLRLVADHAGAAIANARAFNEIDRLRRRLELENSYLREEVREANNFDQIIGMSLPLEQVRRQIEQVAPTDASVLISGATGTGKELVAREIHRKSLRRDRPLIKVNCPSIPKDLWESEFFGHVKGAFTGAIKDRAGRFELANEGTLFLDEIGEIPIELQSRLLCVLQEGRFERVGDERTRKVDVRIIAASNRDLDSEITLGNFRRDLFYRLNVFPIHVPRLAERKEDIPLLASHFLRLTAEKLNRPAAILREESLQSLMAYHWPGNIRELRNVVERAIITSGPEHLDFNLSSPAADAGVAPLSKEAQTRTPHSTPVVPMSEIKRLEEENIAAALELTRGKIYGLDGAAELLGMKPTTLCSRVSRRRSS